MKDDFGTPIANELAKITSYMLLVISAMVLEKYLITSLGFIAGTIIPIAAFIMGVLWLVFQNKRKKRLAAEYAIRLIIFGICIALIIPLGCACGRGIEALNKEPISKSLKDAETVNEIKEQLPENEEDKSIIEKAISNVLKGIKQKLDWAVDTFNGFLQTVSVMLITTIVIPILVFFAFILIIRFLTKKDFTGLILGYSNKFARRTTYRLTDFSKKSVDHISECRSKKQDSDK